MAFSTHLGFYLSTTPVHFLSGAFSRTPTVQTWELALVHPILGGGTSWLYWSQLRPASRGQNGTWCPMSETLNQGQRPCFWFLLHWLSPEASTWCFSTSQTSLAPWLWLWHTSRPAQLCCPVPHRQAFRIPGSHVAHSRAYSSILADFCLEYKLGKHRYFVHIRHKQFERGKRTSIVHYVGHQRLRVFCLEHNAGNWFGFKV